jgi:hypothetical protein
MRFSALRKTLLGCGLVMGALCAWADAQEAKFLPPPPAAVESIPPWLLADLSQAPEIHFQKVEQLREPLLSKEPDKLTPEDQQVLQRLRDQKSQDILQTVTKINQVNEAATDHFMKVLVKSRSDLAGLPWAMGDDCRLNKGRSAALVREVNVLRNTMRGKKGEPPADFVGTETRIDKLPWALYDRTVDNLKSKLAPSFKEEDLPPARIAALMQILGPASAEVRQEMIKRIAAMKDAEAGRALAKLAVFSEEGEVRKAARAALKDRKQEEYVPILLQGLRYPWPAIARNATEAMVALGCRDLTPTLVAFLDEPDPRAPTARGRKTPVVREVVKINHHRNCLLCHAPVNPNDSTSPATASAVVMGEIPNPAQPLPSQSRGYKSFKVPSQFAIRVDVTYLRQDFSLLQKVANAAPWPELQRFDFLVREREATAAEVKAYADWATKHGPGYLSPNHQVAHEALRALTGHDAQPTAEAWRKALGL